MKITSSVNIKNTPEVVFGWLENPQKAMQWMTSVSSGEILHETPDKVGTTYREVVQDENGSMEMHVRSQALMKRIMQNPTTTLY